MQWIRDRLSEKSTRAGLVVLAAQAGMLLAPELALLFNAISIAAGGGAIVMREGR